MKKLKLSYSDKARELFEIRTAREIVDLAKTDFLDIATIVITADDEALLKPAVAEFKIPVFLIEEAGKPISDELLSKVFRVIDLDKSGVQFYNDQIENAATTYENKLLPPFFKALVDFVEAGFGNYATPGHHGGQYFCKHPSGKAFVDFFGENLFRADLSSSDVQMGDLLIHEGAPCDAEQYAASVFKADKTYFVLNGTSGSNKVVLNAALAPGDIILYDRNNHKSISQGALVQAGAIPVFLEDARNPYGSIGGIKSHCFEEDYIRKLIAEKDPVKAKEERPIRIAVIQLGTYDGCIYNARQVVDRIGHLCDYILFDSAWVGYEQFIPMMKDCSPMLLELGPNDPGIFVTQSVHKQLAGISMASQIHKKDRHIKGQDRYIPHKRVNNAFMLHASTSPCYPIFASLDVNAKMHEGKAGIRMWVDTVKNAIEARKAVLRNCKYVRPLLPKEVYGKKWEDGDTEKMANDLEYWKLTPGAKWHGFKGYGKDQYFVDPMKLQFLTAGINIETGEYEENGVPANVIANYLRENGIIPEKTDLNAVLFVLTPAETKSKMDDLIAKLVRFEQLYEADAPMEELLPNIYAANKDVYKGFTIKMLCQKMHNFYKDRKVNVLQERLFHADYLPEWAMTAQQANFEFVANHGELIPLDQAQGRIALEGALPYPPGILTIHPGERWSETCVNYFLALQEGINLLPGFTPEIQGVYLETEPDGSKRAYGYVLKKEYDPKFQK